MKLSVVCRQKKFLKDNGAGIKFILTDRLHKKLAENGNNLFVVNLRSLTGKEIMLASKLNIRRYYLPDLSKHESSQFFKAFDHFWDSLVKPFDSNHLFWRNAVSSKMQEWEGSACYLALTLFTLAQNADRGAESIIIVCSSLEQEDICREWGRIYGWRVYNRPFLSLPLWCRRIFQEIRNFKKFLRMFAVCLYKKWFSLEHKQKHLSKKSRTLIVSRFYSRCFTGDRYSDPFFGDLHEILRQECRQDVVYLADPLDHYHRTAKKTGRLTQVSVINPYSVISWVELAGLGLKMLLMRLRLPCTDFCGCDFSRLIMWDARRFDYFFNFDSHIYFMALLKLCRYEHYEKMILLYEGNVFERACIQAYRKKSDGMINGYSQAVVYPLNLKIRLTDGEKESKPEPEKLISTGPEAKRLMVEIGTRRESTMVSGCALRSVPDDAGKREPGKAGKNILVALDGVWSCVTVLDWLMEQQEIFREYSVTVREHPNVPLSKLLKQTIHKLPDNFSFSLNDLATDIKESFCVIYRQTSVGMQAIMNGIPAVHLKIDAPLSCDPIVDLETFKWTVSNSEEMTKALQEIHCLGKDEARHGAAAAKRYAEHYFSAPVREDIPRLFADTKQV